MCRRYLDGIVLLDDATILGGVRFALERMKQVLEPAGAAALAAVLSGRIPIAGWRASLRRGVGWQHRRGPARRAARRRRVR